METQRKDQKAMLEVKNTVIEMKNAFDRFISRWNLSQERISELENISVKTSQTEVLRKTRMDGNRIFKNVGQLKKV